MLYIIINVEYVNLINMFTLISGPVDLEAKLSEKEENEKSG